MSDMELPNKDEISGQVKASEFKAPEPEPEIQASLHRSRILRKLDMRILPMMLITYGLQFLDKAVLGYAAVYTFREDTHLHGQQYSWVGSIFYFGYFLFEYPLASLLHSFHASVYLGFFISAWGICVLMTNFCTSFAGLMVNRFVLGALESIVAPSFVLNGIRKRSSPFRQVIWFAGTPLFGIFGGLLGYAFGFTHAAVSPWRLLYIVFGSITAVWSIFFALFFPTSPDKASFLTEDERAYSALLSQERHNSFESKWKWSQVKEACLDIKTYLFFAIGIANTIPAGSLSNFSSLLIKGFGFTSVQTQLIGIPSHVIQILSLLISGLIATKTKDLRLIIMSFCVIPSIIGTALVYTLPHTNQWGRVVSIWIIYTNSASLAVSFSVIGGNVVGFTKKTTTTFVLFLGYCIGNLIAPQFFLSREEKSGYPTAIIAMIVSFAALFIIPLALRYLYAMENKRRDLHAAESGCEWPEVDDVDLTDIEDRSFRYAL
ncbi:hypothetical protein N7495_004629 [Penicillium taxi]|uniref:uncharacterized protein n=1 Tax=Penicillium taxi TaxID=168475 RepID=UPI0025452F6E|nr:uncharacterized protein N7495_004629 [Penicillium taxi]KAJ5899885.1 hypothetical protein N7495_004629 [Penicillium taxi]